MFGIAIVFNVCYNINEIKGNIMNEIEKYHKSPIERIKAVIRKKDERYSRSLIEFIKRGLERNGGDYEQIKRRFCAISEFFEALNDEGLRRQFSGMLSAYNDFFVNSNSIKNVMFSDVDYSALYVKERKKYGLTFDKDITQKTLHGVAITSKPNSNIPILYFGARRSLAEVMREDTGIMFMDESVVYHNQGMTRYDEIPLFGKGAHGEFNFDKQDRLKSVTLKTMKEPRLGLWGEPITMVFDNKRFRLVDNTCHNFLQEPENW